MDSTQNGYRGTGMVHVKNPEDVQAINQEQQAPEITLPVAPSAGPKARDVYQNLQVLGDLSVAEMVSSMTAMTQWVAPDEGCTYCHAAANFASDELYTKVVARRMLQMTQSINSQWADHVGDTGVTCYTCHRGNPVPAYYWSEGLAEKQAGGMAAQRGSQNLASSSVGYASLPGDPFSALLMGADEINVASESSLPSGDSLGMYETEQTYGLMMHMSESLGVNCTFCHNSRSFSEWDQSNPTRATAWHGIRMVRDVNQTFLAPLQSVYPDKRLGHMGDAPKANCSTCHQGVSKPMYGKSMLDQFNALRGTPANAEQN
jgi:photosynthetic reaction center cytochrome c subunit